MKEKMNDVHKLSRISYNIRNKTKCGWKNNTMKMIKRFGCFYAKKIPSNNYKEIERETEGVEGRWFLFNIRRIADEMRNAT